MPPSFNLRLAIVTHVPHYRVGKQLFAYGPYAREIEIWADLFSEIVILAPCREEPVPGDCVMLSRPNISVRAQKEFGGPGLIDKFVLMANTPAMLWNLFKGMRTADAVHVRCPGNLGLLGTLLAPMCSRYLVAKYAGQWTHYPGEAFTSRVQRGLLRSKWWHGPVTVYGKWPNEPDHIIPFFTSILSDEQIVRARQVASRRQPGAPLTVLYLGRLSQSKNVDVLLQAISNVRTLGHAIRCLVVGEGPERPALEAQVSELGMGSCVEFTGGVDFQRVPDFLERSDVMVLASQTEGWPKALAEAMAFGLVCIASNRSIVPQMLADGRGFTVEPRDVDGLTRTLTRIVESPESLQPLQHRAAEWAQQYSLDNLRDQLRILLEKHWSVAPVSAPATQVRT